MDHFKMSTSRDFRINAAVLTNTLEDMEASSDENEGSGNGEQVLLNEPSYWLISLDQAV